MQESFSKIKDVVSDPQTLMFEVRKNKRDVFFWAAGMIFTILTFLFISSKDYSFLIVLSSTVQMLSFIIIVWKVHSYQNCSGLSLNTMNSYLILLSSRLCSTLFYNGYLPSDKAGDWFYQLTEMISLFCTILLVYLMKNTYRDTANTYDDNVDFRYLAFPALALALLVHTSLNRNFITDVAWTFSMYLEALQFTPKFIYFLKRVDT